MTTLLAPLACGQLLFHLAVVLQEQGRVHIELVIKSCEQFGFGAVELGTGDATDLRVEGVVVILVVRVLDGEEEGGQYDPI